MENRAAVEFTPLVMSQRVFDPRRCYFLWLCEEVTQGFWMT